MSDEELFARVEAGDVDAFDVLYGRHGAYVNGICFHFLRSREESEEVLQEVFLQLWEGRIRYRPERARLTTWLFYIAKSRCLDRLKANVRRLPHGSPPAESIDPEDDTPETDAEAAENRQRVRQALAALPMQQREAVETCFFSAKTYREAAVVLGIPLGTLKGRVRLAMNKLAAALEPEECKD